MGQQLDPNVVFEVRVDHETVRGGSGKVSNEEGKLYENLVNGELVRVVNNYADVNPNNEIVICFNLETVPKLDGQKINKYHITESTLRMYYLKVEQSQ